MTLLEDDIADLEADINQIQDGVEEMETDINQQDDKFVIVEGNVA